MAAAEPALASFVHATILNHERMEQALSYHLAQKLRNDDVGAMQLRQVFDQAFADAPSLGDDVRADLSAIFERDPAVNTYVEPFLFFKGFHALQAYRVTHWLWVKGRKAMALHFQSRISELFQVDIHPAAKLGSGLFLDHGTGIVIGETAVVGDEVSMLHAVTLGGTGAGRGDRHPKIGKGVLLGAGAKVLGNITVGDYAKVASGSVVLKAVPAGCTVAGVPARLVNCPTEATPARTMDHTLADIVYDFVI